MTSSNRWGSKDWEVAAQSDTSWAVVNPPFVIIAGGTGEFGDLEV